MSNNNEFQVAPDASPVEFDRRTFLRGLAGSIVGGTALAGTAACGNSGPYSRGTGTEGGFVPEEPGLEEAQGAEQLAAEAEERQTVVEARAGRVEGVMYNIMGFALRIAECDESFEVARNDISGESTFTNAAARSGHPGRFPAVIIEFRPGEEQFDSGRYDPSAMNVDIAGEIDDEYRRVSTRGVTQRNPDQLPDSATGLLDGRYLYPSRITGTYNDQAINVYYNQPDQPDSGVGSVRPEGANPDAELPFENTIANINATLSRLEAEYPF